MHVFVTGATGWVGSRVVEELLAAGHQVDGLARSAEKAAPRAGEGMTVVQGTLDDERVLLDSAGKADAVIHTAFNHDFSNYAASVAQDRRAIEVLGKALAGKPMLVTSGIAGLRGDGQPAVEEDKPGPSYPRQSEAAADAVREAGGKVATVRLPPTVHGVGDAHGFVPHLIRLARRSGVSAFPGDGQNRWSAVHRDDAARLFRLALERGVTEKVYHAVAEPGVSTREIAEAIGEHLQLPVESRPAEHFDWLAMFAGLDMAGDSRQTQSALGWQPTGPTLIEDLTRPAYYASASEA